MIKKRETINLQQCIITFTVFLLLFCAISVGNCFNFQTSVNHFAVQFYQTIGGDYETNMFVSPLLLQAALTAAYAGANGATAKYLSYGLVFANTTRSTAYSDLHSMLQELIDANSDDLSFDIANGVFIMDSLSVSPTFITSANNVYSTVSQINFANATAAATTMNNWVAQQTNNNIQNFINPSDITAGTNLYLASAIYFKGLWINPFDRSLTAPGPFFLDRKNSVIIDMMQVTNTFKYGHIEYLGATVISLPYTDPNFAMIILVPQVEGGLADMEAKYLNIHLATIYNDLTDTYVQVNIPKFTLNFGLQLQHVLTQMGMGIIFENNADFSGMLTEYSQLPVSNVMHQAYINVNEDGVEAAIEDKDVVLGAAALSSSSSEEQVPVQFTANQPFSFVIYQPSTLNIIFAGRFIKQ